MLRTHWYYYCMDLLFPLPWNLLRDRSLVDPAAWTAINSINFIHSGNTYSACWTSKCTSAGRERQAANETSQRQIGHLPVVYLPSALWQQLGHLAAAVHTSGERRRFFQILDSLASRIWILKAKRLGTVFRKRLNWPKFWAQSKIFRIRGAWESLAKAWLGAPGELDRDEQAGSWKLTSCTRLKGVGRKNLLMTEKRASPHQNKTQIDGEKHSPMQEYLLILVSVIYKGWSSQVIIGFDKGALSYPIMILVGKSSPIEQMMATRHINRSLYGQYWVPSLFFSHVFCQVMLFNFLNLPSLIAL